MIPLVSRPRRLRTSPGLRRLVQETSLSPSNFILPLFAVEGSGVRRPIPSLPGVNHESVDKLLQTCARAFDLGIPGVLLFGIPGRKDEQGSGAWDPKGPAARAVQAIKKKLPGLVVITDVCLCGYTTHGHCGVVREGKIENDATVELLARSALCHARAGADLVAPSDMMDGRVAGIRAVLDRAGFTDTGILSYAVKYASAYYGPFREAFDSKPSFGDRRGHQMDPANIREAVREARLDEAEGADILMVKPALAYLDVIRAVKEATHLPLAAYNVSGEYAMVKAAAARDLIDEKAVVLESLLAMRRAGAGILITYHALDAARWLAGEKRIS